LPTTGTDDDGLPFRDNIHLTGQSSVAIACTPELAAIVGLKSSIKLDIFLIIVERGVGEKPIQR